MILVKIIVSTKNVFWSKHLWMNVRLFLLFIKNYTHMIFKHICVCINNTPILCWVLCVTTVASILMEHIVMRITLFVGVLTTALAALTIAATASAVMHCSLHTTPHTHHNTLPTVRHRCSVQYITTCLQVITRLQHIIN